MLRILRGGLRLLLLLVLAGAVVACAMIGFVYYMETYLPAVAESDVIIVLGAQVREDGTPSVALERRLTAALESYTLKRQTLIVCGAQGANEPRAEGDVMREWLLARSTPARICATRGRSWSGADCPGRSSSPAITMWRVRSCSAGRRVFPRPARAARPSRNTLSRITSARASAGSSWRLKRC